MILITAYSENYRKYGEALVQSILTNTPYNIFVYIVNTPPDSFRHPRLFKHYEFMGFKSPEEKADYMANQRVEMMLRLRNFFLPTQSLLWLDADSLIRKSIYEVENMLDVEKVDTVAYKREEEPFCNSEQNQYLISTVGVAATPGGNYFLLNWARITRELRQVGDPSIMTVQIAYNRALKHAETRFKSIDKKFTDMDFSGDSPIWEGQGRRKSQDKRFIEELEGYYREYQKNAESAAGTLSH